MFKKALIAAGLVAASSAAFAAAAPVMNANATPWYVGVGLDYSPVWTEDFNNQKIDSRGFGGTAFVGYHVNKYFGTELGFDVLAQNKYKNTNNNGRTKVKSRWNIHFNGNAYLPVNEWFSPFAFAGVAWYNQKVSHTGATGPVSYNVSNGQPSKYSGLALDYGAGLQFNIQQFGIRAKYTQFELSNNNNTEQDLVSLDLLYRFGM